MGWVRLNTETRQYGVARFEGKSSYIAYQNMMTLPETFATLEEAEEYARKLNGDKKNYRLHYVAINLNTEKVRD